MMTPGRGVPAAISVLAAISWHVNTEQQPSKTRFFELREAGQKL